MRGENVDQELVRDMIKLWASIATYRWVIPEGKIKEEAAAQQLHAHGVSEIWHNCMNYRKSKLQFQLKHALMNTSF